MLNVLEFLQTAKGFFFSTNFSEIEGFNRTKNVTE